MNSRVWALLGTLFLLRGALARGSRRRPHGAVPVYRHPEVDPSSRRLQGLYGDANCPCINPWKAMGGIPRNISFYEPETYAKCLKYLPEPGAKSFCYPLEYGSSSCDSWDRNQAPWCADATGRPLYVAPRFCAAHWCYVSRSNCTLAPIRSEYFPGYDLWYSYETCSSVDYFAVELITKSLRGRVLKVGLPRPEPPFIQFREDQAAPNGVTGITGITHDLLQELAKIGGFRLEFVKHTEESLAVFPKSSYSACVRDVALHRVDLCAGIFYETPERRSMATFSPTYFPDLMFLVVFKGKLGAMDMLGNMFMPFSLTLWFVIVGLALGAGVSLYIFGESIETSPVMGTLSGMRLAALKFLGQGRDLTKTEAGQTVLMGCCIVSFFAVASYTANLTAIFSIADHVTSIKDIYDAIEQKTMVCALEPQKGLILGKYPASENIWIWVSWFDEAVNKMDAGECAGMLLNENEYARMFANVDFWGSTGNPHQHCGKVRVGDTVTAVPIGFPVQREIEHAVGYLMVKLRSDGILEQIMQKYPRPDSECDHVEGLNEHSPALEPGDFLGMTIFCLITLGLGFLANFFERRALRKAHNELTKKGGLVRKSRFERVKKRFSGEKHASSESLGEENIVVDEGFFREDDLSTSPPHVGHFGGNNRNSDDEGKHGKLQDLGHQQRTITAIGRQVGFLTEIVCRLQEDVAAVRQHLHTKNEDSGHSNGAVSLISTWAPIKQVECLSASSSSVTHPPGTSMDALWSEKVWGMHTRHVII